jgi:hypothetical protein
VDALDELLADLQELLDSQESAPATARPDEGNFRCVRCEGCSNCRFCVECRDCDECTYCETSIACRNCTQCRACHDCERTSHSMLSRACDDCSYVVLSVGCESCVHCFACVGLANAEFCLLNEQYSRRDYQAKLAELRPILDARIGKGWRPAWLVDGDEPKAESAADDDTREPDAPTWGRRIEEAASPRASGHDPAPTSPERAAEGRALAMGRPPTLPGEDTAVHGRGGGPSVTRAGRPAAPPASPPEPAATPSVLSARRPPRA